MSRSDPSEPAEMTRRRALLGGAGMLAVAAAAGATAAPRRAMPNAMMVKPSGAATRSRTSLHQEVHFDAPPARVYQALLGAKAFAAFTGMKAQIDPRPGGAISIFGGLVVGRNVELVRNRRIVQAWRPVEDFPAGVYSLVKMELLPAGSGTRLILDHTGFPEGHYDHLNAGWPPRYWIPLKKYLG
jgi:activator of HSP90 ATPase